jgi:hypothetical protein
MFFMILTPGHHKDNSIKTECSYLISIFLP